MSIKSKIQACYDLLNMRKIKNKKNFQVMTIEETIQLIIDKKLSVSRYGDGEVFMMANQMNESFQTYDKEMSIKLQRVINEHIENHLVCIPGIFDSLDGYTSQAREWFSYFNRRKKYLYYKYFDENTTYGNSMMTRLYMDYENKNNSEKYFNMLKKIWDDRDIVFIEGEFSRLGVGNDLFDNAKSIKRILAPATNAYVCYDKIIQQAKLLDKNVLILLALGATATCLAYDLCKEGYQSIDIGHVDIEYEWMRMGATKKTPIPSKYVNECGEKGKVNNPMSDEKYLSEIIARIK